MVELAAEPLFVLAQAQLRFRLRVAVDATAHVTKAALILALLRFRLASEITTLCLAQVFAIYALLCIRIVRFHCMQSVAGPLQLQALLRVHCQCNK